MSSRQRQFDALVRATSADLYRFAYWLCKDDAVAQDLVQGTFLRAWRSLDDLRDPAAAKGWLLTILRRENANRFERKSLPIEPIDELDLDDRESATPDEETDQALIRAAMRRLEPKYREPLLLQVLGGYSCEEIARELELSVAAVTTQLFRARQKLRHALAGDAGVEGNVHELP